MRSALPEKKLYNQNPIQISNQKQLFNSFSIVRGVFAGWVKHFFLDMDHLPINSTQNK